MHLHQSWTEGHPGIMIYIRTSQKQERIYSSLHTSYSARPASDQADLVLHHQHDSLLSIIIVQALTELTLFIHCREALVMEWPDRICADIYRCIDSDRTHSIARHAHNATNKIDGKAKFTRMRI